MNNNNYRPIVFLSIFSKTLEKGVKQRLIHFLDKNNLFSIKQFGFRDKLNTNYALLQFMS